MTGPRRVVICPTHVVDDLKLPTDLLPSFLSSGDGAWLDRRYVRYAKYDHVKLATSQDATKSCCASPAMIVLTHAYTGRDNADRCLHTGIPHVELGIFSVSGTLYPGTRMFPDLKVGGRYDIN